MPIGQKPGQGACWAGRFLEAKEAVPAAIVEVAGGGGQRPSLQMRRMQLTSPFSFYAVAFAWAETWPLPLLCWPYFWKTKT
mmetsp:Transcript_20645/g.38841  ORF Transcript_20645/g.38841 Transcript_20645/m.38841 type:complete len:81 (+) Transcript_20645:943-1185(+)